ncbi:hypothetical protein [Athalassotoga saccharophila]|uniref:hypothetical protein n=1 Tax=Athalassotoga saccharophila TaxID=1441386 RepID=UPI00137B094C|nr:hypothetical protein [Athalassotoga saccharophila]BBJ28661.1 hypothetical protein ATHSA_1580 [Athalassotoga saccharophila]
MIWIFVLFFFNLAMGLVSMNIAESKGINERAAFFLGLILGFLGLLIILVLPDQGKQDDKWNNKK